MNPLLDALLERVSIPAEMLTDPAPDEAALQNIVQAAVCVPDHAALRPWRFLAIQGEARERLGEVFREATRRADPQASEAALAAAAAKPLRAPLILAVISATRAHPKVPVHEQRASAAAAAYAALLAANALGYGGIWLTGPYATDPHVREALGVGAEEHVEAFLYLGTPGPQAALARKKLQNRPRAADYLRAWSG